MDSTDKKLSERILYCIAFVQNHAATKQKQIIKIKINPELWSLMPVSSFKTFVTNGLKEIFVMGIPIVFDNEIDGAEFVLGKL